MIEISFLIFFFEDIVQGLMLVYLKRISARFPFYRQQTVPLRVKEEFG
jgi:hypothetical protein